MPFLNASLRDAQSEFGARLRIQLCAHVWFRALAHAQVSLHVVTGGERPRAFDACVIAHAQVRVHVSLEVLMLPEDLRAVLVRACERLLSRVHVLVLLDVGGAREHALTESTLESFLAGVRQLVHLHVGLLTERARAQLACKVTLVYKGRTVSVRRIVSTRQQQTPLVFTLLDLC